MGHQFQQFGVVVAGNLHLSIMFTDEGHRLTQFVLRETTFHSTQIEFTDNAIGNSIAVEYRFPGFHGKTLEGMTDGVAQIQSFPNAMLLGVFVDDALFHLDGISQKLV